jgi:hypothetical protein
MPRPQQFYCAYITFFYDFCQHKRFCYPVPTTAPLIFRRGAVQHGREQSLISRNVMPSIDQINAAVQQVTELRRLARDNPALLNALSEVKQLQSRRFAGTYSDLLNQAPYQSAARFFLAELYGDKDFSQRDEQFFRLSAGLEHFFIVPLMNAAVSLAQLHSLTETLDMAMAQRWLEDPYTDEAARYLRAWRLVNRRPDRLHQLQKVLELGRILERMTRTPGLQLVLRMMRQPAFLAGLGDLQQFLESGFIAFHAMTQSPEGTASFLNAIESRESSMITMLFDADVLVCEMEIRQALARACNL